MKMGHSTSSVMSLFLAIILFIALNIFSNNLFRSAQLDLTADRLYTLSDGSKNILSSIPEPIRLRLYFSEKLATGVPSVKAYGNRVRELLEKYADLSKGRIKLEIIDPEPFSDSEDEAVRLGMQAILIGQDNLYFGLVGTNTTDHREVIPFFSRDKEQFLEYDLTRLIYNLTDPKRPIIGLITGHEMNAHVNKLMRLGGGPQPWPIIEFLQQTFDLRLLSLRDGPIDGTVDVLLLVHPPAMNELELYHIDQFVMGGGKLVLYVDPHSEVAASAARNPMRQGPKLSDKSDLERLLKTWGVTVGTNLVVGDYAAAQQVNASYSGTPKILRYLPWLELSGKQFNKDDIVTNNLGPIVLASSGRIALTENSAVKLIPLISSSKESMLFSSDEIRMGPAPERLLEIFKADGIEHVIAGRVQGRVVSAFPEGPPKALTGESSNQLHKKVKHLNESNAPINIIIVADSDLLYEQFWLRKQNLMGQNVMIPLAANADMLFNILDNMSGSNDLIGLRSRGKSTRPFEVVEELRRTAEQKFLARERELTERLEKTQKSIADLETRQSAGGGALLSRDQRLAIQTARGEIIKTRRELRLVQRDLNRDIEELERALKFANIGLVPILVSIVAVLLAMVRYRRRRSRRDTLRT